MRRFTNLLVFLGIFSFLGYCGLNRLIAKDEGFYLLASDLVLAGKFPYFDFFYPQSPYLPYLYIFSKIIPFDSLSSARIFSGLISSLAFYLMYLLVKKKHGNIIAISFISLILTSNFIFPWFATIKTYALSLLGIILTYSLLQNETAKTRNYALSGLILGITVGVRLMFLPLAGIFFIWLLLKKVNVKNLTIFTVAGFTGILPMLLFFLHDFDIAWFNNIAYHQIRWAVTEETAELHFSKILLTLIGWRKASSFSAFQFPIIFWIFSVHVLIKFIKTRKASLISILAIASLIVSLLPQPIYLQYFCIPFALMFFDIFLNLDWHSIYTYSKHRTKIILITGLLLIVYFYGISTDFQSYLKTGTGVIGMQGEIAKNWSIPQIEKIQLKVAELAKGKQVISLWPGYIAGTGAIPYFGTENHFGYNAARQLNDELNLKYKIISLKDISTAISNKSADLLVLSAKDLSNGKIRNAVKMQYQLIAKIDPVSFYKAK